MHPEIELAKHNALKDLQTGWLAVDTFVEKFLDNYRVQDDVAGALELTAQQKGDFTTLLHQMLDDEQFMRMLSQQYGRQELLRGLP